MDVGDKIEYTDFKLIIKTKVLYVSPNAYITEVDAEFNERHNWNCVNNKNESTLLPLYFHMREVANGLGFYRKRSWK